VNFFSLCRVEFKRLALTKFTWTAAAFSLCGPLFGYSLYQQSNAAITNGRYIANPVLAGTVIGAVLWAALCLFEADRVCRSKTDVLVDAVVSPVRMALIRMATLTTMSTAVCFLCALIYLPYTIVKADYLFDVSLYTMSFLILMRPTWWVSILLADAFYRITRRIELAGLLYAACVYFCFSRYAINDYFFRWINPLVLTYSDGFSSLYYLRIAFYTRIMWLALAGGLWIFSLLCIRRYQKNLALSFLRGLKKVYLSITAVALLSAGTLLWIRQPFVDHGPAEWDMGWRNEFYKNVFNEVTVTYRLTAKPITGRWHGIAEYIMASGSAQTISMGLNPGYSILRITCDSEDIDFISTSEIGTDERRTIFTLTADGWKTLTIEYEGYPTMLRCFAPFNWGHEITNKYIFLNNAGSIPMLYGLSIPDSVTIPDTYTLELKLPGTLIPIADHKVLTDFTENDDGTKTWTAESDYGLWLMAGDYIVEPFYAAGINVDFIYNRKYQKNMREFNIPASIAEVLTYCTERLGPLEWAGDNNLMMVQRSAIFDGGNAGKGWVEWGESYFTASNLSDPFKGANASEVFIHEMIHQWWGGLGVWCGSEWEALIDEPWSEEGLTVYYTYRLMKDKYGDAYAKKYYIDVWQNAVGIQKRGFYYRHPEYLDKLPERYRAGLNSAFRITNAYCRMPLMILKAERLVGGEEKMDKLLRGVQEEYASTGTSFTYQIFLDLCGLRAEDLTLE